MSEEEGKKEREWESSKGEGEGGRKKGSEWGRAREAAAVLKEQKSCSALSHRKTLGLEEAQGSCASHWLPICHSLTALSNRAFSRLYQWRLRQWNGRPLHRPACPLEHQALLTHPKGPHFSSPPIFSFVFVMLFFYRKPHFFCSLLWVAVGFHFVTEGPSEGKQGFRSLA